VTSKKFKVNSIILFAFEIILFWIVFFLHGFLWLYNYDTIADFLRLVTIAIFILIILTGILVIFRMEKEIFQDTTITMLKRIGFLIIFLVFGTLHIWMYQSFYDAGTTSFVLTNITDKQTKGNECYFYVTRFNHRIGKEVEVGINCTKEEYQKLVIDKKVQYSFEYRYLDYLPYKGVLEDRIDMKHIIDNRRRKLNE
jgi:hypothetical protein